MCLVPRVAGPRRQHPRGKRVEVQSSSREARRREDLTSDAWNFTWSVGVFPSARCLYRRVRVNRTFTTLPRPAGSQEPLSHLLLPLPAVEDPSSIHSTISVPGRSHSPVGRSRGLEQPLTPKVSTRPFSRPLGTPPGVS